MAQEIVDVSGQSGTQIRQMQNLIGIYPDLYLWKMV